MNAEVFDFFEDVLFFSGGGFDDNGLFELGNFSDGLRVVLEFTEYLFSEDQLADFYEDLKIIISTINRANLEKARSQSGDKT